MDDRDQSDPGSIGFEGSTPRSPLFWRSKTILQWLSCSTFVFMLLRMSIGCGIAFRLTNRTVAWLPFAFEMIVSIVALALSSRFWARGSSMLLSSAIFIVLWFSVITVALNIAVFASVGKLIGEAFFEPEPGSPLNDQNAHIYSVLLCYVVLTAIGFALQFAEFAFLFFRYYCYLVASPYPLFLQISACTVIFYLSESSLRNTSRKAEKSPLLSSRNGTPAAEQDNYWAPATWRWITTSKKFFWVSLILFALVTIVWSGLFIAGLADIVATFTQVYYCPPHDPGCYSGCDPVDPTECLYPFPSSHWLQPDENTPTGWNFNIPQSALPQVRSGKTADPRYWNELDGFSTVGPLLFFLPNVSAAGLNGPLNIGASLLPNSTTVLINTATNQSVPHWAEYDVVDPRYPSIIIQPAVPMEYGVRYVVGVRRLTSNDTTNVLKPSLAMSSLLDTQYNESQRLVRHERWNYYQNYVLPWLVDVKQFTRQEIQMAWDFHTMSRELALDRAERMRDDALERQKNGSVTYQINTVVDSDCSVRPNDTIGRTIYGQVNTPLYLTTNQRLAKLPRTEKGHRVELLTPHGTHASRFIMRIPCSLLTANGTKTAKALIQYGHGLFGSRAEVRAGWIATVANKFDWIFFANDWFGMAKFDVLGMFRVLLGDPTAFVGLPESSLQGFVDKALTLRTIDMISRNETSLMAGGKPLIDLNSTTTLGYYGISQGGILGGAYVAFSPDHKRGVLGVPGTPYALLLGRSVDFDLYKTIFRLNMYTWRHIRIGITLMGQLWDQSESAGWLSLMTSEGKQVLLQAAIYDAQVTTLGAHIMARAYGAYTITNQTRPIWGVQERTAPLPADSSAIVEWQYTFTPPEPVEDVPPLKSFDTHGCVRKEIEGQLQIQQFIETGIINQYCVGACVKPKCP